MSEIVSEIFNRRFVLAHRPTALPDDDHFQMQRVAVKSAGDGEVLIRILLVALSPWQGQRLKDFSNYTKPFEIGELIDCDVLGQVIQSNSDQLASGTLVTGRLGWQEYAIATPEQVTAVSTEFSDTLWLTALSSPGLTAYCALHMFGAPMPGETMVVTSAAGSVGSYAVQLGKLAGMRVIGIAGTDEKCELVRDVLGADVAVNHNHPDYAALLAAASDKGVNLFYDTVGGPVADCVFDNLAKYARVLIVGRTASNNSERPDLDFINMRQLWAREASIQCFSRYSYPRQWADARERMLNLCRDKRIRAVDQVVNGFENTPTALRDMLAGRYAGKVLVRYAQRNV